MKDPYKSLECPATYSYKKLPCYLSEMLRFIDGTTSLRSEIKSPGRFRNVKSRLLSLQQGEELLAVNSTHYGLDLAPVQLVETDEYHHTRLIACLDVLEDVY